MTSGKRWERDSGCTQWRHLCALTDSTPSLSIPKNRIPASKVQKCNTTEVRDIPRVTCSSMYYTATRIRGMQKSLACVPQGELPSSSTRRIPAIWFGRTKICFQFECQDQMQGMQDRVVNFARLPLSPSHELHLYSTYFFREHTLFMRS